MMFDDLRTVRLIGEQIKHGPRRKGYPVVSQIEKRRKETPRSYDNKWRMEFIKVGKPVEVLEGEAAEATEEVARLEKEFRDLKKDVDALAEQKRALGQRTIAGNGDKLWQTKQELRLQRKSYLEKEVQLRHGRARKHQLNMMLKAAPNNATSEEEQTSSSSTGDGASNTSTQKMSVPSLDNFCTEDKAHLIDISALRTSDQVGLVFGGTDYGVATMSKTVPLTAEVVQGHFDHFWRQSKCVSNKQKNMILKKGQYD